MMNRALILAAALVVAFAGPVTASHERYDDGTAPGVHWRKDANNNRPTIYIENRVALSNVDNLLLQTDHRWGANAPNMGPVINYVDLWALNSSQRTRGGDDCTPRQGMIVVCIHEASEWPNAAWTHDSTRHFGWCIVRAKLSVWLGQGGWNVEDVLEHEIGHCLGLKHGGTGIMNGTGVIDGHDLDAVAYGHQVVSGGPGDPHQHNP